MQAQVVASAEVADMLVSCTYVDTGWYQAPRGVASLNAMHMSAKPHIWEIVVAQLQ